MKLEERVLNVESTIDQGERIGLSIDAEDMPHIMDMVTDLYEDSELACIREYSTNALDAHVEAGVTRPIEVTLPTNLSPFLKIRDYGFGLDKGDIRDVYTKYGKSTKRDTNDAVGMLGLGCKSALTYTDQFSITSIKDGIKYEVSVSRDEDGGGGATPVDEYPTDEPSGVEITIPVLRYNNFENKAAEFFQYWTPGTVLVNDEQPKRIGTDNGFWIADDLLILESRSEDVVVMGNVAYPFLGQSSQYRNYSIVAFVPIGSVTFTPSREALRDNKKTRDAIEAIYERVDNEAATAVEREIDSASDLREALKLYHETTSLFNFKVEAKYKGKKIPEASDAPKNGPDFVVVKPTGAKYYREKGWHRMNAIPSSIWPTTYWIRGYNGTDFSPYKRKKLDQWLAEKGLTEPKQYVFTTIVPNHHWIDKATIFPWSEIEAQKIVKENTQLQNGRVSGSYQGYIDGLWQNEIKAEDIDTKKPLLYANRTTGWSQNSFDIANKENPNGYTLIELASNRIAKFIRDFPMAKELTDYATDLAEKWAAKLTDDQKLTLVIKKEAGSDYDLGVLKRLKAEDIEDPELVTTLEKMATGDTKLYNTYQRYAGFLNGAITEDVEWNNPLEKYPLLGQIRLYGTMEEHMQQEITIYVNAAYAARQEEV